MKNIGMLLLAVWLVLTGAISLFSIRIPSGDLLMAILALAAGALILFDQRKLRFTGNLGMLLLSIWLLAFGLFQVLSISFPASGIVLAILAIAAGVLLLLKR